ncbi:MAG: hypothetical protein KH423_05860 [Actinomycetaceae bacterium]|nr:hypothetical protein [Actinomycetaceae bacterium]
MIYLAGNLINILREGRCLIYKIPKYWYLTGGIEKRLVNDDANVTKVMNVNCGNFDLSV